MSRQSDTVRALRVGLVLVIAVALFAAGIWTLGESSRVWSKKAQYRVSFSNVQGLSQGAPVRLSGFTIGTVRDIRLPDDIGEARVEVVIAIEKHNSRFIRVDTRARLRTVGLLGDRFIDLSQAGDSSAPLPPGSEIAAEHQPTLEEIIQQGESVADNLVVLTTSMRRIVEKVDRGEGLLGAMIMDTKEGQQITADIKATAATLRSLSVKIDEGKGAVGMLLNDPSSANNLKDAIAHLNRIATRLDSADGLLPRLLSDEAYGEDVLTNVAQASAEVRSVAQALNSPDGLLSRLGRDDELAEAVLGNLERTTASFAKVASRIEGGEGSLGKLIQDETLYRGINDIVAGSSKSILTRWFVSHSQRQGAMDRLERSPPAAP